MIRAQLIDMSKHSACPAIADLPPPPAGKAGWPWNEAGPNPDNQDATDIHLAAVAIVTPSYNQAEFLEETIRSVLLQGYPKLSYAIMDGGSTDGSVAIIQKYAPWLDHWVCEPDGGQAAAIDKGFQRIEGEILTWLNSDDVLAPGAVWAAVDAFRCNPTAVLVYGDAEMINREGTHLGRVREVGMCDRQYLLTQSNAIVQPSAFFLRTAYETAGKLNHTLYWALDYDLWIRLTEHGALIYVPQTWSQTRLYREAKTSQRSPAMFDEIRAVAERYGGHGLPAEMAVVLEYVLMPSAISALRAGDLSEGQPQLVSVLDHIPSWRSETRLAEVLVNLGWRRINEAGADRQAALQWISQICLAIPDRFIAPKRLERRVLGLLYEALAFQSYHQGRSAAGLGYAVRAIVQDRRRAANRGLWAITLRSLVHWPN